MARDRMVGGEEASDEQDFHWGLRPKSIDEYIGQPETVERLRIAIEASKARGETLDHLLVHGPPGLGKCIAADSLILTDKGLVEFEALIPPHMAAQSSQAARVMVYGLDGLEPTSRIYASGRVPTRRLKTRSGFVLEGTPHHPLWAATLQGAAWKPLQDLAPGDWVAVARGTEVWGQPRTLTWYPDAPSHRRERSEAIVRQLHDGLQTTLQRAPSAAELRRTWSASCGTGNTPTAQKTAQRLGLRLSDGRLLRASARRPDHNKNFDLPLNAETAIRLYAELGYILGALVGDGHMEKGGGFPSFIITCEDAAIQHQLTLASQNVFGSAPQPRKYGDKATRMRFSQNMGEVCLAAGFRPALAASKTVPTAILSGPREAAIGFLQGLFDADGHARADGVEWGTRSETLARQAQLLLLNLGVIAHRRMQQKVGAPFWILYIGGHEATRFCEIVGFRLRRKQDCLRQTVGTGWQRSDFVPHAAELLTALLKQALPQPRSVHKAFDHAKRDDRHFTRSQIAKLLALLPSAVQTAPEYRVLQELMSPRIFWDRIESLEPGETETYDFVVPGTHSFVANGFYNHNTTLAYIIAEELGREISITSGPALERPGDVMPFLTNADDGDIIFIDEIHRLPRVVEEFLYSAMEDYMVNFTLDKGMYSKPLPFRLKKFTIVGATTRPAMLTRPLRDRFGIQQHLDFYNEADLVKIARRSAKILDVKMDNGGAHELARRARGTPRIVNRLLRRVRDYAQVRADGIISDEVAHAALRLEGIDDKGLDRLDHGVLRVIMDTYNGGPVGIDALAATLNEEVDTLVDVVEPYLLKIGFLARTPSGRRITRRAYEHLGEPPPPGAISNQPSLLDEAYDVNESLRQKSKERRKDEIGEDKED